MKKVFLTTMLLMFVAISTVSCKDKTVTTEEGTTDTVTVPTTDTVVVDSTTTTEVKVDTLE